MFRTDVVDTDDQRLMDAGMRAYGVLHGAVGELIDAEGLDADVDAAVELCWAAMQGLVVIEPKLVPDRCTVPDGRRSPRASASVA